MTLTEKIKFIAVKKNYTFASLERELNLGQGTIRKWDYSSPSADKLMRVANFLSVSMDWLLKDGDDILKEMDNNSERETGHFLTEDEKLLLENYRDLTEEQKDKVCGSAARMAIKSGNKKSFKCQNSKGDSEFGKELSGLG